MVEEDNLTLILSEDAFVLFENVDENYGKICFWSTLYSLVDMQINKLQKIASINFYNDETVNLSFLKQGEEKYLKLKIDNILFFREALVKRMNGLKIKAEQKKIMKGQLLEKKITDKEVNTMKIDDLIKNIKVFNQKLETNDITYYNVKTLMNLCQKVLIDKNRQLNTTRQLMIIIICST
jgi:hypothetical protein